jgi:hypothetical protein
MLTHEVQGRLTQQQNQGYVSGKKWGRAVRLGLCFEGQNYQYFKTLFFQNVTVP